MTYTISYKLKSSLTDCELLEEIGITSEVEEAIEIPGEIENLRAIVFDATLSSTLLETLRSKKRTVDYEVQKAAAQIQQMKSVWEKSAEFLRVQGLKDDVPDFPLTNEEFESVPQLLQSVDGDRFWLSGSKEQLDDIPF